MTVASMVVFQRAFQMVSVMEALKESGWQLQGYFR